VSDTLVIAVVSAVAAVTAATLTAVIGRRNVRDTTRIDEFQAALAGLKEVIAAQGVRLESLESDLVAVKTALVDERKQHNETRELLRVAMRHIRDMLSWLGGNRADAPPTVPDELTHQL
jgi:septal ring factor EnvC (AmiA/AmiB activator)